MELDDDTDDPEAEVELDSLGSFFVYLIDNDRLKDDAEASHADHVEVILLSSDSDPIPIQRIRRIVRKVKQSHPLAHLDPKFSLKTQQAAEHRKTRHNGQQITSGRCFRVGVSAKPDEVIC